MVGVLMRRAYFHVSYAIYIDGLIAVAASRWAIRTAAHLLQSVGVK